MTAIKDCLLSKTKEKLLAIMLLEKRGRLVEMGEPCCAALTNTEETKTIKDTKRSR